MNRYIKLKKRNPIEKFYSIVVIKQFLKYLPPDSVKRHFFLKNGKLNFLNELRAGRLVEKMQRRDNNADD